MTDKGFWPNTIYPKIATKNELHFSFKSESCRIGFYGIYYYDAAGWNLRNKLNGILNRMYRDSRGLPRKERVKA